MRSSNFMAFLDSLSTCVPVLFLVGRFHRVYEISFSPQTVRRNDTMEHVREELDRLIQQRRLGYSSISRMIGRNSSYIQQFIKRGRSEEHTSELQSLMRISYAVFCLKKKKYKNTTKTTTIIIII